MMRTILIALAGVMLTGCAVYTVPQPVPYHTWPPTIYQDPWPVRVPIQPSQPAVIYEDNRQYHYYQHQHTPKKKP